MRKLPLYFILALMLFSSCTQKGCEACNRQWDRKTAEHYYHISYYGLMGQELRHADEFRGFLHNDEGIDLWYIKPGNFGAPDTTVQIMRGDFGTTVAKSWK